MNRLPLATVQSGSKHGDNEGAARKALIPIETSDKKEPAAIRQAFALLFAPTRRRPSCVTRPLKFIENAPLHTSEAAGIGGHAEGKHRENLREFEELSLKSGAKKGALAKLEPAFWGLYDPASVAAFIDNLFPTPLSLAVSRPRGGDRSPRLVKKVKTDSPKTQMERENEAKKKARVMAYEERPLSEEEEKVLSDLGRGASSLIDAVNACKLSVMIPAGGGAAQSNAICGSPVV